MVVGGKGWGTPEKFWQFRGFWMGNWSVNKGNPVLGRLTRAIEDARSGSNWPPGGASQLGSAMRVYGYNDLRFDEYNRKNDWP